MTQLYFRRDNCRLCEGRDLTRVLNLTPTPPANAFVPEEQVNQRQDTYPLDVHMCGVCGHVQLLDVVNPEILFSDYVYVSGTSPVFVDHFRRYADTIVSAYHVQRGSLAVDIGSNDGTLLEQFKNLGLSVLGVDPAKKIATEATARGIETIVGFFDQQTVELIRSGQGPASIVTANNVFAHADNLMEIGQGVRNLLAPNGVFVFEVSYLGDVLEKTLFDTIYHEHVSYHSVAPLVTFFNRNDLELIHAERVDTHGGSLRGVCQLKGGPWERQDSVRRFLDTEAEQKLDVAATYLAFAQKIEKRKQELYELLSDIKASGKSVAAYGAPAKATTLMYHFGLGPETVDFIVDDSPLKQGLYSPGLHVPILLSDAVSERKPDYLLILAWNFTDSIVAKCKNFRDAGGRLIVPLPEVRVI